MLVRNLIECREFLAGDHTRLRELLHPSRGAFQIGYSLAHGILDPGTRSKRHRLASSEVYYFLAGQGLFSVEGEAVPVRAGSVVYVPPGATQCVENKGGGPLEFLCLVDPPWKPQDEDVFEQRKEPEA